MTVWPIKFHENPLIVSKYISGGHTDRQTHTHTHTHTHRWAGDFIRTFVVFHKLS
jgi:hypothetical protein